MQVEEVYWYLEKNSYIFIYIYINCSDYVSTDFVHRKCFVRITLLYPSPNYFISPLYKINISNDTFRKKMTNETHFRKYSSEFCDNDMTFEECEIAILRNAIDENERLREKSKIRSEGIHKIIRIVELFLIKKKCVCYGGTAINDILPKNAQFYDKEIEIPDYDFFTPHALDYAKDLADIYYKEGYTDVEAKAGAHYGTFKVYVNFLPIADITYMDPQIYKVIQREAITKNGIKYAPPDFLRMSMYLELSRPKGMVSRWEKVMKRLNLLNQFYPFETNNQCRSIDFQRSNALNQEMSETIYYNVRDSFIDQQVVFFGGYATSLYSKYMPKKLRKALKKIPDFDVISEDKERCAILVKERLEDAGIKHVQIIEHDPIGEIIPAHTEIRVGKETVAFVYSPIACHNYNTIHIEGREIRVATIDTILSFYFAFMYVEEYFPFKDRIVCMAKFLFDVEQENRLAQKGLLKRFTIQCVGKQPSVEDIRAEKAQKYKELKNKKGSLDYDMWFLKYVPSEKEAFSDKTKDSEKEEEQESQKREKLDSQEISRNKKKMTRKRRKRKGNKTSRRIEQGYLF